MPTDVLLRINGKEVRTETFYLQNIPLIRYAYIENHVLWDETNTFELKMIGLNENSFLGIYIGYPDVCEGIDAAPIVFDEVAKPSRLHLDKGLIIDSVEVSPDVIDDTDCEYTVTVKTAVAPELIEAVYCILPTQPSMPALEYNSEKGVWQGKFGSGRRRFNIFLNREIVAWIKSRDGGIGEQKSCEIKTRYVWKK